MKNYINKFIVSSLLLAMVFGINGCGQSFMQPDPLSSTETSTITNSVKTTSTSEAKILPLELVDHGFCLSSTSIYGDSVYIEYCGMVHNPNESLIAEFPKVAVTVKGGDGSILATGDQMGGIIMPGDTVTLNGMLSVSIGEIDEKTQIVFNVECSRFAKSTSIYKNVSTDEFVFEHVTEHKGNGGSKITGEITNTSEYDLNMVYVSLILRKDGKIVFIDNTFVDGLSAGKTKAFEFTKLLGEWPEYDTIECSAMPWM